MDDRQCDGFDARLVLVEERTERNDKRITAHGRQIDSLRSDMDRIKTMFDRYQVTLDRLEMKVDKILEVPSSRWNGVGRDNGGVHVRRDARRVPSVRRHIDWRQE